MNMKADTPDNLDELYDCLPEDERLTATILRQLIRETLPEIREKKSYGAPFYFGKKAICYVWPCSITWGGRRQGAGVTLGFQQARKFDPEGKLDYGNRKLIGTRVYLRAEDIDVAVVEEWLRQAWAVDGK